MTELYHRFEGYDLLKPLLDGSHEDVLVALAGKPALIRIPGTERGPGARLIACLLHGNEDSGYRAAVDLLRAGAHWPFDLWVLVGNVRAASSEGWFAHRYLDDQEDFNRVWGAIRPTTRMRRCAGAILDELASANLHAAVDLHNNTGQNPFYTIAPVNDAETIRLASLCCDTLLLWGQRALTLMEALSAYCPAVAVECGLPGRLEHAAFAARVIDRFLSADLGNIDGHAPSRVLEIRYRVSVRREVPFAFGGALTDDVDLVLRPELDAHNFGMLLAGTVIGRASPGAAMPLVATDMQRRDTTERFFRITGSGDIVVTEDVIPVMFTTTVEQTRRDCLFYVTRPS
jgi:hypothetical protein